jgi:hypothetical protein
MKHYRSTRRLVLAAFLAATPVAATSAQRVSPVAFGRAGVRGPRVPLNVAARHFDVAMRADTSDGNHVVSGALRGGMWGALIGAGAGAITAFALIHNSGPVTDHSEDGLPLLFIPYGAILGGPVGALVGALRAAHLSD